MQLSPFICLILLTTAAPISEYLGSMVETMTLGWGLLRQANLEHKQVSNPAL